MRPGSAPFVLQQFENVKLQQSWHIPQGKYFFLLGFRLRWPNLWTQPVSFAWFWCRRNACRPRLCLKQNAKGRQSVFVLLQRRSASAARFACLRACQRLLHCRAASVKSPNIANLLPIYGLPAANSNLHCLLSFCPASHSIHSAECCLYFRAYMLGVAFPPIDQLLCRSLNSRKVGDTHWRTSVRSLFSATL